MQISRREFLQVASYMAGAIGLQTSGLTKLREALAAPGAPPVIWLQGQSCTGCSVSFLNSINIATAEDLLLNSISLEYHPNLSAAAGDFAISAASVMRPSPGELQGIAKDWLATDSNFDLDGDGTVNLVDLAKLATRKYILVIEGAIPAGADGDFCHIAENMSMLDAVKVFSENASHIVAVGTCASYGGIPASGTNPTDALSVTEALAHLGLGNTVINIPGCPIHPDWLVGTLVNVLTGQPVPLDAHRRPLAYYGAKIHDEGNCPYKGDREIKVLGQKGCLKALGCKGPKTFADCFSRKWNSPAVGQDGVSWCIDAGSPCIGCTEPGFPDGDFAPFYKLGSGDTSPAPADGLVIKKSEYKIAAQELRVEANSSGQPNDVLTVEGYGDMPWKVDKGKYEYRQSIVPDPSGPVTINSDSGDSITVAISYTDDFHGNGITIRKAAYKVGDQELRVEANSIDQPNTILTLEGYGPMNWNNDKGKYEYRVKPIAAPPSTITVTSNIGGSDFKTVKYE